MTTQGRRKVRTFQKSPRRKYRAGTRPVLKPQPWTRSRRLPADHDVGGRVALGELEPVVAQGLVVPQVFRPDPVGADVVDRLAELHPRALQEAVVEQEPVAPVSGLGGVRQRHHVGLGEAARLKTVGVHEDADRDPELRVRPLDQVEQVGQRNGDGVDLDLGQPVQQAADVALASAGPLPIVEAGGVELKPIPWR